QDQLRLPGERPPARPLAPDPAASGRSGAPRPGLGRPPRSGAPRRRDPRRADRPDPGLPAVMSRPARAAGLVLGLLVGGLAACAAPRGAAVPSPAGALRPVSRLGTSRLHDDGDRSSLAAAVRQSLAWIEREPPDRAFVVGPRTVTAAEQGRGLRRFLDLL